MQTCSHLPVDAYIDASISNRVLDAGQVGIAVILQDAAGDIVSIGRPLEFWHQSDDPTERGNAVEYQAIITALQTAQALGIQRITVHCDNLWVVHQIQGRYSANGGQRWHSRACRLLKQFEQAAVVWIPREENKRADELAKQARMAGVEEAKWRYSISETMATEPLRK